MLCGRSSSLFALQQITLSGGWHRSSRRASHAIHVVSHSFLFAVGLEKTDKTLRPENVPLSTTGSETSLLKDCPTSPFEISIPGQGRPEINTLPTIRPDRGTEERPMWVGNKPTGMLQY